MVSKTKKNDNDLLSMMVSKNQEQKRLQHTDSTIFRGAFRCVTKNLLNSSDYRK